MPGEVSTHHLACRDIIGDKARVGLADNRLARFFLFRLLKKGIGVDRIDQAHCGVDVGDHLRLNGGDDIAGSSRPVVEAALLVMEKGVIAIGLSAVRVQSVKAVASERFLQLMSISTELGMLITSVVSTPIYISLQ